MKKIVSLLMAVLLCSFALAGCGGGSETASYNLSDIVAAVEKVNPVSNPRDVDDNFIQLDMLLTPDNIAEYAGKVSNDQGNSEPSEAYIPFSTLQTIYNKGNKLNNILLTTDGLTSIESNEAFEQEYRRVIGANHRFSPDDTSAIWIWNRFTDYLRTMNAMGILRTAIWVIGIFTLLSGIVGVSNIMLITVRERTHEFGIRKALGAKPASILWLIIIESITITTLFGYIGMVAGIGVTEWMDNTFGNQTMDASMFQAKMFSDPTVDLRIAIQATLTLVIAGTLAGFFPARKATKIKPIEALRAD